MSHVYSPSDSLQVSHESIIETLASSALAGLLCAFCWHVFRLIYWAYYAPIDQKLINLLLLWSFIYLPPAIAGIYAGISIPATRVAALLVTLFSAIFFDGCLSVWILEREGFEVGLRVGFLMIVRYYEDDYVQWIKYFAHLAGFFIVGSAIRDWMRSNNSLQPTSLTGRG